MTFVLLLAAILLGATAIAAAAALTLPSALSFGVAAYLISFAELVVLTELLSPLELVGTGGYLVGELLFLAAATYAWHLRGRPRFSSRLDLQAAARAHPLVAALAVAVAIGLLYAVFVGLATPPNNGDAMAYRLSRAVAWLQHGGIHWIPDAHTERENEFPWVTEIPILWTFALLGRDTAAAMPQIAALAALVLAVTGCARRLGYSRAASAFAGLLTATLTEVALQSAQTQNDLIVASFVASAAYFVRSTDPAELALAGVAGGLAVGSKVYAFLVLPILAFLAAVSVPRRRAPVAVAAAAAAAAFLALAAPAYVQNIAHTGGAFGEAAEVEVYRPDLTATGTVSTVARALYRFVDVSGFRIRTRWLQPVADTGEAIFEGLGIPPDAPESAGSPFTYEINVVAHEDHSFFGPLGILLVLPLSIVFAIAWPLARTTAAHAAYALALPIFLVLIALVFRFTDEGRYLMSAVVLTMPLAASLYRRRTLAIGAAALGVATLFFAHAYNALKPTGLGDTTAAWDLPRPLAQGIGTPGIGEMIAELDARVPPEARLGVVLAENARDYPLYGPELDRELVPLPNPGVLEAADRAGLDWVFVGIEQRVPPLEGRWRRIDLAGTATLLRRR